MCIRDRSKKSLCLLIKKYKNTGSVADACKARRPRKLQEHYRFIDDAMAENDQLTSRQLHQSHQEAFPGVEVSISTIKRAERELGWVGKRTRYCALISDNNKEKRVSLCREQLEGGDFEFENVVWTDECTVQLKSHLRWTFHRVGEPAVNRLKMKPKHPPKINVLVGIST